VKPCYVVCHAAVAWCTPDIASGSDAVSIRATTTAVHSANILAHVNAPILLRFLADYHRMRAGCPRARKKTVWLDSVALLTAHHFVLTPHAQMTVVTPPMSK
jgi:hypothetical protein